MAKNDAVAWRLNNLETLNDHLGKSNVVTCVHYSVVAAPHDDTVVTAHNDTQSFPAPESADDYNEGFVEIVLGGDSNPTEEVFIGWVKEALGEEAVQAKEQAMLDAIARKRADDANKGQISLSDLHPAQPEEAEEPAE